jgi:hypothetical protein
MGTRAVVKYEGKPMLATHWDGYPTELGVYLIKSKKTVPDIIKTATRFNIDLIDPKFAPKKEISTPSKVYNFDKHKSVKGVKITKFLTEDQMNKYGDIGTFDTKGNVEIKLAEIIPFKQYGDFAEWEYDIRGNKVYVRKIDDSYQKRKVSSRWYKLDNKSKAEKVQKKVEDQNTREFWKQELAKVRKDPEYGASEVYKELGSSWSSTGYGDKFGTVNVFKTSLDKKDKLSINKYLSVSKGQKADTVGQRMAL